ncbi:MAG TPA: pyrroline-5-carboxylate reductase [Caulobacteraceae bacterium]|nr:pyrroline-5-carboxylate reductase [Caulobacteraceae bacterium]
MTDKILMLGAGRMGGALLKGWALKDAIDPAAVIVRDPHVSDEVAASGVAVNPPEASYGEVGVVLLAVKPQMWREAVGRLPGLGADPVVVSIAAGVKAADISAAFGGARVARVMPTTGVGIGKGVASIFSADTGARNLAHVLFDPVAATVDLPSENLMDVATAVSGSAPAYLYAFIEALEAAGAAHGLDPAAAQRLARATVTSAAALLDLEGGEPAELRRQVTSPGGTTEAALKVLMGEGGFPHLLDQAVAAAVARAKELG